MSTQLPVLPLRDIVVFPHMVVSLFVGREKSVRALEALEPGNREVLLLTQRNAGDDDPVAADLYETGTVAGVVQLLKLPDGTVKLLVEGRRRARFNALSDATGYYRAEVEPLEDEGEEDGPAAALVENVLQQFKSLGRMNRKVPGDVASQLAEEEGASKVADVVAANLGLKVPDRQKLLETLNVGKRLEMVLGFMEGELGVLQVEKRIRNRVKRQMEKTQREYYLNEQLKAIQRELGESDEGGRDEVAELEARLAKAKLPKEAHAKAAAEIKKLRSMSPMSAEATVVRNYLDVMLALPWSRRSKLKHDIMEAERILDEDHYGLKTIKERILEHLAVQARTRTLAGPILCLVGPPGVGKTSLAKSIARATGRKFVRQSLGGVRDEAEIRGHRRTYIGSMPGKILQNMRRAETSNPLMLLDEIDKIGSDYRGDPAAALLEVLDPEQNARFSDHYLEVDFDLSQVMFVCTANTLNLPPALLDRMEIIRLAGYTEEEKVEIARRHLLPKALTAHGVKEGEFTLTDDGLVALIRYYTREAGVRNLDREIARLVRKSLRRILEGTSASVTISEENLGDFAGVRKFRTDMAEKEPQVGATTGLAWTEAGGDLLSIETVTSSGRGQVKMTGKLGDVMQESVTIALSLIRARAERYGIAPAMLKFRDIHVHVPEGATPKDGPSAGIAIVTAMLSTLTGVPVRADVAMTGEVTLRGRVLPIGGLKEKLLAAVRGGIKTVIIPAENEKDLAEVPGVVTEALRIVPVSTVDEVLELALERPLGGEGWVEDASFAPPAGAVLPEAPPPVAH